MSLLLGIYLVVSIVISLVLIPMGFYYAITKTAEEVGNDLGLQALAGILVLLLAPCIGFMWPASLLFGGVYKYIQHQDKRRAIVGEPLLLSKKKRPLY